MEAWEALDVDDSDLPSLLRPCRRRQQNHTSTTISHSQSIHSQTLDFLSQQVDHAPPRTTYSRIIPGPAGAIHAAMLRKTRDNHNFSCRDGKDHPIPTQEYVEEDDDFRRNPWRCAVEFLIGEGMADDVLPGTRLSSVKNFLNNGKVDKVVALVKSCTRNGFGDMMVTLKDPTGTIGASIHGKVLTEAEFGRDISIGSVLILQQVAVFAPSRSAHYLNITLSNVVKVIRKDSGPPLEKNYPVSAIKYAAPGIECSKKTGMLQRTFSLEQGRTEGIVNEIRQNVNVRGISHNGNQKEKGNLLPGSGYCSNGSSINQNAAVDKEPLLVRQDAANEIFKEAVGMGIFDDDRGTLDDNYKLPNGANLSGSQQHSSAAANLFENHSGQEIQKIDGVQKQRQPLIAGASLPQWTDEQLNELFAGDCEDDVSLF